jgi:hypothetical protein
MTKLLFFFASVPRHSISSRTLLADNKRLFLAARKNISPIHRPNGNFFWKGLSETMTLLILIKLS